MRLLSMVALLLAGPTCMSYRSPATSTCETEGDRTAIDETTGHCLMFYAERRSWPSAKVWCDLGGSLAMPFSCERSALIPER